MDERTLIARLDGYGRWLDGQLDAGLRPDHPTQRDDVAATAERPKGDDIVIEVEQLLPVGAPSERGRRRGHRYWLVATAAALVVLAGLATVIVPDGRQRDPALASASEDPDDALFVLPSPRSGVSVTNGSITSSAEMPLGWLESYAMVGRPEGDGYGELWAVNVSVGGENGALPGDPVEVPGGPAAQIGLGDSAIVVQDRADQRVTVAARGDTDVVSLFDRLTVGEGGELQIELVDDEVIIDQRPPQRMRPVGTTIFDAIVDSVESPISVETAAAQSALGLAVIHVADSLTPIGDGAWLATRNDGTGVWNGVAWQATPNRVVAVSGYVSVEELIRVAGSLQIVDEATWREAVGTLVDE